jgi:phage terminase large subunit-like protein
MKRGTLPSGTPEHTLGWGLLSWAAHYIRQPDGPNAGGDFRFTREQVRYLLWWYSVDERGRFAYQSGVLRRPKGWGKSPFLAALAIMELIGPCRFSHFDDNGQVVGKAESLPHVQIAAVAEEQTRNTMDMIQAMLNESPAIEDYALDVAYSRVFVKSGGKGGQLKAITAASRSQEGKRPTFVVMDETHHWIENNGGHKLAEVIRRNLGKSRGGTARSIEATNAHDPNEGSVAERSWMAALAIIENRVHDASASILYDASEAPGDGTLSDETWLRETALPEAYGDSLAWLDIDRLITEIYDIRTPTEVSRRFYLNQIVASADAWLDAQDIDAACEPEKLADGEQIALGFDGSKTDDASALVACRISDGKIFTLAVWEKEDRPADQERWEIDRDAVDGAVAYAHETYDVVAFFSDLHPFESYVDKWAEDYREDYVVKASAKHAVAFDMRARLYDFTKGAEGFADALAEGTMKLDAHPTMTRHLKNARSRMNRHGVGFGKESRESLRKVDAAAAAVLARLARAAAVLAGIPRRRGKSTGKLVGWS